MAIGTYFSRRRDSGEGQAVIQAVGLGTQTETVQQEKTLLEAKEEVVRKNQEERKRRKEVKAGRKKKAKRLQQLEEDKQEQEELLALQDEINRREDEAERSKQEKLFMEAIKSLKESSEEEPAKKSKKKPTPKEKTAPSKKVVQAEKKKLEEFVKRRSFKEEIVGVKLRKASKSKYPTIFLARKGDSTASKEVKLVDLFKLGFTECVELYNIILLKTMPRNYEVVTGDLSKRFKRIKIVCVDTTGLIQPTTPENYDEDEEDEDDVPLLQRRIK